VAFAFHGSKGSGGGLARQSDISPFTRTTHTRLAINGGSGIGRKIIIIIIGNALCQILVFCQIRHIEGKIERLAENMGPIGRRLSIVKEATVELVGLKAGLPNDPHLLIFHKQSITPQNDVPANGLALTPPMGGTTERLSCTLNS
jgi:hypothetical protein